MDNKFVALNDVSAFSMGDYNDIKKNVISKEFKLSIWEEIQFILVQVFCLIYVISYAYVTYLQVKSNTHLPIEPIHTTVYLVR